MRKDDSRKDESLARRLTWPIEWVVQEAPRWWEQANVVQGWPRKGTTPEEVAAAERLDTISQEVLTGETPVVEDDPELVSLSQVAAVVADAVHPVQPAPRFRRELKQALLATHRQQVAQRSIFEQAMFHRAEGSSLRPWHVAATVPVLIGILALIWRRSRSTSNQAAEAAA